MNERHEHIHGPGCGHDIPDTMQACQYRGKRVPLEVATVAVPQIGPDEALVRVVASGVCRSDWHLWNGDWGWLGLDLPDHAVLGHEIGGQIVKTGSAVKHVEPGLRVTIPFNFGCGNCEYCRQGAQHLCAAQMNPLSVAGAGGWQQYIRVPNADLNCVPLPQGVDELTAAALGCRYMTAWRGVADRAKVRGGEFVAVLGCGGVGLAAVQIATALGGRAIAVDIDDGKLALARQNGAVATVNARGLSPDEVGAAVQQATGGHGAEVAIDALGGSKASLGGLFSLRKGGRLVQIGLTGAEDKGTVGLPLDLLVLKELSIIGSQGNPQSAYPHLLGLVASGRLTPKSLVSREIALDEVQSVLDDMDQYKTSGYVIITKF
ncbi:alcohol dehydrogenase catalytic domain-containing protein [Caballeronia sp. AZ7_KS35]|uniref:alcohol dehydrogenase catalytic domain-containing protein n=1 Tax=Caballeronia sp. AZ7_KS35 TaxID=2921762 RepID=UPI002028C57F|nr:alcohol dehydrogenase catalytic domain-containing protein [Caballeronia sp. AZ7_KS35]